MGLTTKMAKASAALAAGGLTFFANEGVARADEVLDFREEDVTFTRQSTGTPVTCTIGLFSRLTEYFAEPDVYSADTYTLVENSPECAVTINDLLVEYRLPEDPDGPSHFVRAQGDGRYQFIGLDRVARSNYFADHTVRFADCRGEEACTFTFRTHPK
jgi:hypothetical protein